MEPLAPVPADLPDPLAFTPLPRKKRHNGWTAERQRAFIHALAETGSVKAAARRIGKTTEGAYQLRRQPGAESFRAAWEAALASGVQRLTDIAMERAVEGLAIPVFHKGEQVGERRWYNDRLLMFMLKHHLPDRYGHAPLRPGTKHPDTLAHEAAAECPVCKARASKDPRQAAATKEMSEKDKEEFLVHLMRTYEMKVAAERYARLDGDIVAADLYIRQLTFFELVLEGCGKGMDVIDLHTRRPEHPGEGDRDVNCGPLTDILDKLRRDAWEEAGEPAGPPIDLREFQPDGAMSTYGDMCREREYARDQAQLRIAEAQGVWEAAAREDTWAAFKEQAGAAPWIGRYE